ncbi:hypothetical protein [Methylobacterium nonmethylotrophicum]|jgi:hypothetical protein|uniref:hypothetical protein n=1 Tax=Methylobacterium nonmethylotrophicum TaxID=1141884 RepID=UPI001436ABCA|nr:hypothetical protein [Methylobacterium nonmethylotrophicum]
MSLALRVHRSCIDGVLYFGDQAAELEAQADRLRDVAEDIEEELRPPGPRR